MTKQKETQCLILLNYLEKNKIIGKENAKSGDELIERLKSEYPTYFPIGNRVTIQNLVMHLRRNDIPNHSVTRTIGSGASGYYLITKEESGLDMLERLAKSHLITAIKAGVPRETFYKLLNELSNKALVDGQQKMPTTKYENTEVHISSDDLLD